MTETDAEIMRARRELYARAAQADCLEDASDMITTEIMESGGIMNLPAGCTVRSIARGADTRQMVELQVHGLAVSAPSLLEAVEMWIDTAGMTVAKVEEVA